MVPSGWNFNTLGELATVERGKFSARPRNDPKYYGGSIPFVQTGDIASSKTYLTNYSQTLNEEGLKVSRLFPKNTILITIAANIGDTAITSFDVACPDSLVAIQPDAEKADTYWLKKVLETRKVDLDGKATQNAQKNINLQVLKPLSILTPPLPEQRKIAKILSTWDKAISTTERLIDNSKQQKKALMQQLLTGKKRLLDDSGKRFEGDWEDVKLGDLGTTFTSLSGKTKSDFGSGKLYVPYINIFKNASVAINQLERVNIAEGERQNEVQYGDIFFTTSSETPEEVGMSSVMVDMPNEPVYLNSFCFGFRPYCLEQATPEFMKYVLRSNSARRSISLLAQGATRYNLSKIQLLKIQIALPAKQEQIKIASVLTNADKEIELLEQQLADLKQEKKALMQQLLTGKRRVKIDDKETA